MHKMALFLKSIKQFDIFNYFSSDSGVLNDPVRQEIVDFTSKEEFHRQYKVKQIITRGSNCTIKLAKDRDTNEKVALKIIYK